MKIRIAFAGGGTGGHLYPLIVVADALKKEAAGDELQLFYFGPPNALMDEFEARDITVRHIASSKLRRYFSLGNIIDIPKFLWSIVQAVVKLYRVMPDVVFSKGGPGALAVVLAARWYMIPVVIHDSDSVPGLTNRISAKIAKKILIAFKGATAYFPAAKVMQVGNPIREKLLSGYGNARAMKEQLQFDPVKPLVFVVGGSQGSLPINNFVEENLGTLLKEFQVIHQTGAEHFENAKIFADSTIRELGPEFAPQYKPYAYLSVEQLREFLSAADVVLSRSGASAIFEIAAAGKPSVLIPLESAAGNHQRANAYEYARTGAANVVEESNLTVNVVLSQLKDIVKRSEEASRAAHAFSTPDAARMIAKEILRVVRGD